MQLGLLEVKVMWEKIMETLEEIVVTNSQRGWSKFKPKNECI